MIRLRGEGKIPSAPGLRLVQVGEGVLTSSALFGDFIAPVENRRDDQELSPSTRRKHAGTSRRRRRSCSLWRGSSSS